MSANITGKLGVGVHGAAVLPPVRGLRRRKILAVCELNESLRPSGSLVAFVESLLGCSPNKRASTMYKFIVIIAAAMPAILLLRAILVGRSQKPSRAFSEFKKHIDYLVWVILFVVGCLFIYSVASLIHSMWR
jgi:hypothetical protein